MFFGFVLQINCGKQHFHCIADVCNTAYKPQIKINIFKSTVLAFQNVPASGGHRYCIK
jgi:hypothetical protein